jgi:site-specific DNA-methyltransferase (adenine-specific)
MQNELQIKDQSGNSYNRVLPLVVGGLTITCEDNMALMARYPDNYFDLAIVDPPYGMPKDSTHGRGKLKNRMLNNGSVENWDIKPNPEYFVELERVSKNQIIWGGNYFDLKGSRGFVIWDKEQPFENFSAAEYAWMSFQTVSKIFRLPATRTKDEVKIHPTQKPILLYKWLLDKYAKQGDKILDTHLGSGSIAIACHDYGFDLTACELDKEYYDKAMQRIKNHTNQQKLF